MHQNSRVCTKDCTTTTDYVLPEVLVFLPLSRWLCGIQVVVGVVVQQADLEGSSLVVALCLLGAK